MPKTKRRESRETAFALLFEWSFREDETLEEIIEQAEHCRDVQVDDFAKRLAGKTIDHYIQLDACIDRYSDKWKLNRLSKVTLAVLRMAVCELTYMADIPAGATINEAVELMKKYATTDEAAYVNGVLGAVGRSLDGEKPQEAAETAESGSAAHGE